MCNFPALCVLSVPVTTVSFESTSFSEFQCLCLSVYVPASDEACFQVCQMVTECGTLPMTVCVWYLRGRSACLRGFVSDSTSVVCLDNFSDKPSV